MVMDLSSAERRLARQFGDLARHELDQRMGAQGRRDIGAERIAVDGERAARVAETLELLADRGHPLGICTNKPHAVTEIILEHFGIARLFGCVIGGDSVPERKPHPAPLRAALAGLGADVVDPLHQPMIELLVATDGVVDALTAFDQPGQDVVDIADGKGIVGTVFSDGTVLPGTQAADTPAGNVNAPVQTNPIAYFKRPKEA